MTCSRAFRTSIIQLQPLWGHSTRIQLNNATAVAYIKPPGRLQKSHHSKGSGFCFGQNIMFCPIYCSYSRCRKLADGLPQQSTPGSEECSAHPEVFQTLYPKWGTPDLLASGFNHKLDRLLTRSSDPSAFTVYALVFPWHQSIWFMYFSPTAPSSSPLQVQDGRALQWFSLYMTRPGELGGQTFSDLDILRLLADTLWALPDYPGILSQGLIYHPSSWLLAFTV